MQKTHQQNLQCQARLVEEVLVPPVHGADMLPTSLHVNLEHPGETHQLPEFGKYPLVMLPKKDQPHHFSHIATVQPVELLVFVQQPQNLESFLTPPQLHQLPCWITMMHSNYQMQEVLENPLVTVEFVLEVPGTALLLKLLHSEAANEQKIRGSHSQLVKHVCF
jgi:hypothetical protein